MVTSVTKSIDGVEYTFGADGYMKEGSERAAAEFTLGTLEGNHYRNEWADLELTFPEAVSYTHLMKKGNYTVLREPHLNFLLWTRPWRFSGMSL